MADQPPTVDTPLTGEVVPLVPRQSSLARRVWFLQIVGALFALCTVVTGLIVGLQNSFDQGFVVLALALTLLAVSATLLTRWWYKEQVDEELRLPAVLQVGSLLVLCAALYVAMYHRGSVKGCAMKGLLGTRFTLPEAHFGQCWELPACFGQGDKTLMWTGKTGAPYECRQHTPPPPPPRDRRQF
ncbi:MAG: hypothetical protein MHM6MM_000319 [Cercozoa sp. M6MM]